MLPQTNVPYVKRTMTLKDMQLFWLKVLKTETRLYIRTYVIDVCQRSQKQIMPRAVQKKGVGRFAMGDTVLYYMVLS